MYGLIIFERQERVPLHNIIFLPSTVELPLYRINPCWCKAQNPPSQNNPALTLAREAYWGIDIRNTELGRCSSINYIQFDGGFSCISCYFKLWWWEIIHFFFLVFLHPQYMLPQVYQLLQNRHSSTQIPH